MGYPDERTLGCGCRVGRGGKVYQGCPDIAATLQGLQDLAAGAFVQGGPSLLDMRTTREGLEKAVRTHTAESRRKDAAWEEAERKREQREAARARAHG